MTRATGFDPRGGADPAALDAGAEPDALSDGARTSLAFREAFFAGDVDRARALLAPDYVLYEPASLPYGGTWRGFQGFLDFGAELSRYWHFEAGSFRPVVFGSGARVALQAVLTATAVATGNTVQMGFCEVDRLRDGLIYRTDMYQTDTGLLLAALGLRSDPPT